MIPTLLQLLVWDSFSAIHQQQSEKNHLVDEWSNQNPCYGLQRLSFFLFRYSTAHQLRVQYIKIYIYAAIQSVEDPFYLGLFFDGATRNDCGINI
jgi:hypothetical protein